MSKRIKRNMNITSGSEFERFRLILVLVLTISYVIDAKDVCGSLSSSCNNCVDKPECHFVRFNGENLATTYCWENEMFTSLNLKVHKKFKVLTKEHCNDSLIHDNSTTPRIKTTKISTPKQNVTEKTTTQKTNDDQNSNSTRASPTAKEAVTDKSNETTSEKTQTSKDESTSTKPTKTPTLNNETTTHLNTTTIHKESSFHGGSFFGGIVLVICLSFAAFFGIKYYRAYKDGRPFTFRLFGNNNGFATRHDSDEPGFPF